MTPPPTKKDKAMQIDNIEQRTPEWHAIRLGKVTSTGIAKLTATVKSGGWGASRGNYMAQLICERLTGVPAENYVNAAMQWGIDHEDEARSAYEFLTDNQVEKVGFIHHPKIPQSGASPDGTIPKSNGMVEIKCPLTATHIDALLGSSVAGEYNAQMQWQMACAGAAWCDFVSYDPRLPERMRLFVKRIKRDDTLIAGYEKQVVIFLQELDEKLAMLSRAYGDGGVKAA
jgi:putative phage-type endonuclease